MSDFRQAYVVEVYVEAEDGEEEPTQDQKVELFRQFIEQTISDALSDDLDVLPEYFTIEVSPK